MKTDKKTKLMCFTFEVPCSPYVEIKFEDEDEDVNQQTAEDIANFIEYKIDLLLQSFGGKVKYIKSPIKVKIHPKTDLIAKTDEQRKHTRTK